MIDGIQLLVVATAAVMCGLAGGVFFAFSTFVMKALRQLPPAQGMAAMQAVNITAVEPPFMLAFFGPAVASLLIVVSVIVDYDSATAGYLISGSALYLVGVLLLTAAYHVPRNNALAPLDPGHRASQAHWARYQRSWTAGNHLRTVTSLAAAVLFILALRVG